MSASPFSFRERDYLPEYTGQGIALADAVRQRVSEALGRPVTGAVRLLTQPRSWGLCFNPVSFFYCFDEQEQLAAVLCEVSNTPWRERYHYVLPANGNRNLRCSVAKTFHVSPFPAGGPGVPHALQPAGPAHRRAHGVTGRAN